MKNNSERLSDILSWLDSISYIKTEKIPEVDLYMDQVTSFVDEHLKKTKRSPEDKALTKTMINNYAKNRLLPPPEKKKYSREHMLLLIFIYYFKNILSITDIQSLLNPITEKYFKGNPDFSIEQLYNEVFGMENAQVDSLKKDILEKYTVSSGTFQDAPKEDQEFLQHFAFICMLSFDVYMKKQLIEKLIDTLPEFSPGKKK